jgi:SpoIID/LytB domain protein
MSFLAAAVLGGTAVPRGAWAGGGAITFHGHGKGHGVGMCMAGVYYRALRGESYRDIIQYYYQGVGFSTIDDNMPIRVKCRDGVVRVYTMHDYCIRQQEEPDSWPREGLKVTITAFRTYAYATMLRGKHAAEGYDICSSGSCCQAMNEAIDPARVPNVVAAVNETAGQIITYNGSPIVAAYSSCCGGYTASAQEVWGGSGYPYWQPVYDDACAPAAAHDWDVSFSWPEFEAIINSRSETAVGELFGMVILDRGPSGRVTRVRLEGSAGSKEVSGAFFADILGLPTNFFTLQEQNFDEYLLLQNPNDTDAHVYVDYMMPGGNQWEEDYFLAPHSRLTVYANSALQNTEVSMEVNSDVPVVAERAMYFDFRGSGIKGGHTSTGTTETRRQWFLAEGYCGGDFESWILLQNPQTEAANVHVRYFGNRGVLEEQDYRVEGRSRFTIHADAIPGLEVAEFSAEITSDLPVAVERAMYFGAGDRGGGSCSPPVAETALQWYFAEGYTGGLFDTWLLVMNPDGERSAEVTATFMLPGGKNEEHKIKVPPLSRGTIHVDDLPGLESTDVSALITSDVPVAAERAMYFNYYGRRGGHDSAGVTAASNEWYFAEGCTNANFDTWILLQNPGEEARSVRLTFMLGDGSTRGKDVSVPARSRYTVKVNQVEGMEATDFATQVEADGPVVAERSMYFNYRSRDGGSNSFGVEEPSPQWYFAEGYTGS